MAKTNCTCCSLLTWDYTKPLSRHYIDPKKEDDRKAGGVLIYNGRVLVVQSRANKWGFPKGGFERGENAVKCAEREVHEETSFNIRFSDDDLKVKYKDTTFYIKHLQNKPPEIDIKYLKTPGNDCTGIGWIRLTCLKRLLKKKKKCDLVEPMKNMVIEEESQMMQFNVGVRKFAKQYMERVRNTMKKRGE